MTATLTQPSLLPWDKSSIASVFGRLVNHTVFNLEAMKDAQLALPEYLRRDLTNESIVPRNLSRMMGYEGNPKIGYLSGRSLVNGKIQLKHQGRPPVNPKPVPSAVPMNMLSSIHSGKKDPADIGWSAEEAAEFEKALPPKAKKNSVMEEFSDLCKLEFDYLSALYPKLNGRELYAKARGTEAELALARVLLSSPHYKAEISK